ncbi:hypothetical protein OG453_44550 [Streptomyces sp. NBC_01381]|uniref:hypothetical protein n=1 Tax=Streptomyces sp. NBC_01381 TaxID=2903845 RepID=UPI00224FFDD7|nr:hypothetical protein [Streptomyces sp. NBC_01381]MCX4673630.1 hypothetical protein [Streptomyces sp. NBC_01381]
MPSNDDQQFIEIIKGNGMSTPQESAGHGPYGSPQATPKTGLTPRGKAGIAISAAILSGVGITWFQSNAADQAAQEAKTQEIALQKDRLELERLKELNRADAIDRKDQTTAQRTRQASVDACVKSNASKVGKGYGAPSQRDIVDDCQAQYPTSEDGSDMAAAGSAKDAGAGDGVELNQGTLIGFGAGAALVGYFVIRGRKGNAA